MSSSAQRLSKMSETNPRPGQLNSLLLPTTPLRTHSLPLGPLPPTV